MALRQSPQCPFYAPLAEQSRQCHGTAGTLGPRASTKRSPARSSLPFLAMLKDGHDDDRTACR